MKRLSTILLLILLTWGTSALAEAIVIQGFYQGKDLYVKNPTGPKGVGFCVYEVQVNGEISTDEINSSAFIVDLHVLGLEIGDPVTVEILYDETCRPKVLNSDAVLPQSTYEMLSMNIDEKGVLSWVTKNEMGELPYKVQQFKWNKWVTVGEVIGTGRMEKNNYAFQLDAHSGKNIYRIAQQSTGSKERHSKEMVYEKSGQNVDLLAIQSKNKLEFSSATHFEIFDEYGRLVKRGFDRTVDISSLLKGTHYINYDNRFGESFTKR